MSMSTSQAGAKGGTGCSEAKLKALKDNAAKARLAKQLYRANPSLRPSKVTKNA